MSSEYFIGTSFSPESRVGTSSRGGIDFEHELTAHNVTLSDGTNITLFGESSTALDNPNLGTEYVTPEHKRLFTDDELSTVLGN